MQIRLTFLALITLVAATPAAARPGVSCYEESDRAHLAPVSDTDFNLACTTFSEGASLANDGFAQRALPVLDRSLAAWDVPRTRLYRARTRLVLGLVELALSDAWAATQHQAYGLDPDEIEALQAIEAYALDDALVHVVLAVADTSTIALNGHAVFTGPGRWHGLAAPGAITVTRPDTRWHMVQTAAAGQRLFIELPARSSGAPTFTLGPRRLDEARDLQLRLVGFVVTDPKPPAPLADPAELALPAEQSKRCAIAVTAPARRICTLHAAAHQQLAERINTLRAEYARSVALLKRLTR